MLVLPIVLVLTAAAAHAGWNLIAKRAGGGLPFVLLCGVAGLLLYAPLALMQLVLRAGRLSWAGLAFMVGSGILHAGYFSLLQAGYDAGDLSLVYPIARGTSPLLSVIAAIVILHEHASATELTGVALIIIAILSLAGTARQPHAMPAIGLACLTGIFTAAYTVWDAHAVTALGQPVILYYWGAEGVRVLLLATVAAARRTEVRAAQRTHWRAALRVGALSPAAYILVLTALTLAPVIVVAPAREVSVIIGVVIGAIRLGEGDTAQRVFAAAAIFAGIVLLAAT
jgi:drug/metabolite transporter (DMT)-like permease